MAALDPAPGRSELRVHHPGVQTALQGPGENASWRGWFAGKALPLTVFTLLLVMNGLALPREAMRLGLDWTSIDALELVLRHVLTLGFLVLVIAAYVTRAGVVARAQGFWERVFPLLVPFATFAGLWMVERLGGTQRVDLGVVGLLLTLIGFSVSLWALWYLRRCFGIMAEARLPVTSGPYRYVRHPLYLGEGLSMLGLCLTTGTATALIFWVLWTAMQLVRASVEERKLARHFDEYRGYRECTRFIIPGLY